MGTSVLAELASAITVFEEPPEDETLDLEPVVVADCLDRLRACATEARLVAEAMPALRAARALGGGGGPCAPVLISSEVSAWLDAPVGSADLETLAASMLALAPPAPLPPAVAEALAAAASRQDYSELAAAVAGALFPVSGALYPAAAF